MSRYRIPPTAGSPVLCEHCEITEADVETGGNRWSSRHAIPGSPPSCEPSRTANAIYVRRRRGTSLEGPIQRVGWQTCEVPSCDSPAARCSTLCSDCSRKRNNTHHQKFSINERVLGTYTDSAGNVFGIDCLTRASLLAARSTLTLPKPAAVPSIAATV